MSVAIEHNNNRLVKYLVSKGGIIDAVDKQIDNFI